MILVGASIMLSLSMGMRQSFGLLLGPVTRDLGVSIADFTFAIAVQNIVWGATQPFIGALADRYGCRYIAPTGAVVYAAGLALMMVAKGSLALILGPGVLIGIALSCTASTMAMSVAARTVSPAKRSVVLGIVSGAGSMGSWIAPPLAQSMIAIDGWQLAVTAFIVLCAMMVPAAVAAGTGDKVKGAGAFEQPVSLGGVLGEASRHGGYILMSMAFFVCGLQLAFITNHLPTYLAACGFDAMLGAKLLGVVGLFNIFGSYLFGWLGGRYPKHILLGLAYILRSLCITAYFVLPVSEVSTLIFAAGMGLLWLGVVPLVNGLVASIFGVRYMAMLSGIAFFGHQVGSFVGVWGGGLAYEALGSYDLAWKVGVAIGLIAGGAQLTMNVRPTTRMAAG